VKENVKSEELSADVVGHSAAHPFHSVPLNNSMSADVVGGGPFHSYCCKIGQSIAIEHLNGSLILHFELAVSSVVNISSSCWPAENLQGVFGRLYGTW
jgi:hypothetical protein